MKNLAIAAGLLLAVSLVAGPAVLADTQLFGPQIVITGPGGTPGNIVNDVALASDSGAGFSYSSTGFDGGSGFGSSTYGSYTVTLSASTTGTYFVSGWFDAELGVPYYNEYASVNGSAAGGQSWEVGDPIYSNIGTDALNNTLSNANAIPAGTDNFGGSCATTCVGSNGDVSFAMGFTETLTAGQVETVTFTISANNPGGFNIEQTHPADSGNSGPTTAYFSGSETITTPCTGPNCGGGGGTGGGGTGVPEPGSLVLLGTALCGLMLAARKLAI